MTIVNAQLELDDSDFKKSNFNLRNLLNINDTANDVNKISSDLLDISNSFNKHNSYSLLSDEFNHHNNLSSVNLLNTGTNLNTLSNLPRRSLSVPTPKPNNIRTTSNLDGINNKHHVSDKIGLKGFHDSPISYDLNRSYNYTNNLLNGNNVNYNNDYIYPDVRSRYLSSDLKPSDLYYNDTLYNRHHPRYSLSSDTLFNPSILQKPLVLPSESRISRYNTSNYNFPIDFLCIFYSFIKINLKQLFTQVDDILYGLLLCVVFIVARAISVLSYVLRLLESLVPETSPIKQIISKFQRYLKSYSFKHIMSSFRRRYFRYNYISSNRLLSRTLFSLIFGLVLFQANRFTFNKYYGFVSEGILRNNFCSINYRRESCRPCPIGAVCRSGFALCPAGKALSTAFFNKYVCRDYTNYVHYLIRRKLYNIIGIVRLRHSMITVDEFYNREIRPALLILTGVQKPEETVKTIIRQYLNKIQQAKRPKSVSLYKSVKLNWLTISLSHRVAMISFVLSLCLICALIKPNHLKKYLLNSFYSSSYKDYLDHFYEKSRNVMNMSPIKRLAKRTSLLKGNRDNGRDNIGVRTINPFVSTKKDISSYESPLCMPDVYANDRFIEEARQNSRRSMTTGSLSDSFDITVKSNDEQHGLDDTSHLSNVILESINEDELYKFDFSDNFDSRGQAGLQLASASVPDPNNSVFSPCSNISDLHKCNERNSSESNGKHIFNAASSTPKLTLARITHSDTIDYSLDHIASFTDNLQNADSYDNNSNVFNGESSLNNGINNTEVAIQPSIRSAKLTNSGILNNSTLHYKSTLGNKQSNYSSNALDANSYLNTCYPGKADTTNDKLRQIKLTLQSNLHSHYPTETSVKARLANNISSPNYSVFKSDKTSYFDFNSINKSNMSAGLHSDKILLGYNSININTIDPIGLNNEKNLSNITDPRVDISKYETLRSSQFNSLDSDKNILNSGNTSMRSGNNRVNNQLLKTHQVPHTNNSFNEGSNDPLIEAIDSQINKIDQLTSKFKMFKTN